MPNTEIVPFTFEGVEVRTLVVDRELWWVLADVAKALSIQNSRDIVARLDDDEKGVGQIDTLGGRQTLVTINEAGLYSVILRSDKAEAKRFKRWVTHDVLPTIRQTGAYVLEPAVREIPQDFASALREFAAEIEAHEATRAALEVAQPRAEAWDAIASAEGDYSVGEAAKILARAGVVNMGPTRLFQKLAELGWTYRRDGHWLAYADRVEKGYLGHKPQFHYHPKTGERVVDPPQLRVTLKGIERLRQRLGGTQPVLRAVTA